jgi:two-component system, OmpR family, heavy metal sensor histidine kinase CusS
MFSRSAESTVPGKPEHSQRERRSIADKLTFLHILSVFFTFSVCSIFLYMKLSDYLHQDSSKELRLEIVSVRTMLKAPNGLELLTRDMNSEPYETDYQISFVRVFDRNGRMILESPDMDTILPVSLFPLHGSVQEPRKYRTPSGKLYLLKSADLTSDISGLKGGRLQVGIDISDHDELLLIFRTSLILFILGGFVFAILSAMVIVRQGLKPLASISEVVRRITQRKLHTRIDLEPLPLELVSLAESFNVMLERLEKAFTGLSGYTANLAHELRTPINNLMISAEVALSRPRTPEEYRKVITSSLDDYERLTVIIDKLLFLARADNNQDELIAEPLDLLRELEDVADFYADMAVTAGVKLVCRADALLSADQALFRRAVSNLLSNAITYTPRGGKIDLSGFQADDFSVEVTVADTGCGIDLQHLSKIFERFYRVDTTREYNPEGSGLGLSIVKAVMSLHGGTVDVRSEPGIGTTVILRFPSPITGDQGSLANGTVAKTLP